jgi:hypothetical protein
MANEQQETLTGPVPGLRRRVWCRGVGCGRELTDKISRQRQLGPECDPEPRHASARFDIDQDPIPGL